MTSLTLDMQPDLSQVDATVTALKEAAARRLSDLKLASFEIAVAEALTNAVRYGVRAGLPAAAEGESLEPIRIAMRSDGGDLRLEIIDAGDQGPEDLYDGVVDPAEIDLMAESGRGLSLIRHCVDGLTFEPAPGHNRLVLTFTPDRP